MINTYCWLIKFEYWRVFEIYFINPHLINTNQLLKFKIKYNNLRCFLYNLNISL
jgi:hypothetical protein